MPYSGDQRMEIHVPWCSYEARDKFLIMFYTRPCDQDLIINGSQVFVQGSQLQERKSVWADSSKKWQHYWKFRIQARARSLGCTRDKKQNWKAGKISVVSLLQNLPLCVTLSYSECVASFMDWAFTLFLSPQTTSGLKHSSRTCPWNVKYQELLVSGSNILMNRLFSLFSGGVQFGSGLCQQPPLLWPGKFISEPWYSCVHCKQASATQAVLLVGNPLRRSWENHLYERELITRMGEQLTKKTTTYNLLTCKQGCLPVFYLNCRQYGGQGCI